MVAERATRGVQRQGLSRQRVLDGALAFVDEQGLAALTMRRLGAALGVEGMSLYKHVADKDALLDGIVERLWTEVPDAPHGDDWRDVLRAFGGGLRQLFVRHPNAAPLIATRTFINPEMLRCYDDYARALQDAGFDRGWALGSVGVVAGHTLGYALLELRCAVPDSGSQVQRIRRVTQSLPADVPDRLLEVAIELTSGFDDPETCFAVSIEAVLRGLAPGQADDTT